MGVCISHPVSKHGHTSADGMVRAAGHRADDIISLSGETHHHGTTLDTELYPVLASGDDRLRSSGQQIKEPEEQVESSKIKPQTSDGQLLLQLGAAGDGGNTQQQQLGGLGESGTPSDEGDFGDDEEEDDEALRPGKEFVETMAEFDVGETIGDKYEVLEVMPTGTIGRTYRANSTAHDAQCVFKVLCFTSRESLVESVREDQKVLTRLQHANVLPVYDVMEDPNHENMIVVTSYVSNRNVCSHAGMLMREYSDSTIDRLTTMLRDIGVGLRVLHSHHVYHHNLKLENILQSKHGGCCIADAGYSKLFSTLTIEQLVSLRDPALLPPELFTENCERSQEIAAGKIDVWGFGMSMYRLAFGAYPYDIQPGMSTEDVKKLIVRFKPKEPIDRCPIELWEVIRWALEKKSKDRPSIMKLLRHQFFRIANGQSFVMAGNSTSLPNINSYMNVHRSLTDQHTGFVVSVVLGKGVHSENFLVHLPSLPNKVFVLKALPMSIRRRLDDETPGVKLDLLKKLALSRRIRHKNIAHYYEIVDSSNATQVSTHATQKFFPRGNLAINFPPLDRGGLCVSLMLCDVLRGLICLHDCGVHHLNLKLSNIFYADDECFVIADFGPLMVMPGDIFNSDSMTFHVGVPEHVQHVIKERGSDALQFVDTFCVGLVAASVLPEVRLVVWDMYYGVTDGAVDVERLVGKLALKQQQSGQQYPPHFFDFVTTALTQCKSARELLQHPFVSGESKSTSDLAVFYIDVHDDDLKNAVRDKFVCRDENRLADLLGHGGFLIESPAHALGKAISSYSMNDAARRASAATTAVSTNGGPNDDTMSLSVQNTAPPPAAPVDEVRISYAFMERLSCGQCKKELKLVIYRCPKCSDFILCGKCASVDAHGHDLEPFVIENVCHADVDDEDMMIAILVPPTAINKHTVEELEMQADLPAGTLLKSVNQQNSRSFRSKHGLPAVITTTAGGTLSRVTSMSLGATSPAAGGCNTSQGFGSVFKRNEGICDDDTTSKRGEGASATASCHEGPLNVEGTCQAPAGGKRLLMEHEAMDDTTPQIEVEMCRSNNEKELMLHNFGLTSLPPEIFDPPLAHIVHLDLCNNRIVELPHDIGFLLNLQKLSLANNNLTGLPDSIGDLAELQYLDVSHNHLSDLPQSLMFADKLDTIAMDYNNCTEIPGVILDMPQLRVIYLAENRKINHWPPIQQLQQIGPIKFGLDNEPLLWQEYHSIKAQLPRVTVMWNKIYPDEIIPNLFCGSLRSAQSLSVYDRLNIVYLLTVGRGLEPTVIPGMVHKTVIVDDIEGATIDHSFDEAVQFIEDAQSKGVGCLVHCFAGMSRSATTVIAYLMKRKGMRLDEAYCTTRKGRPAIYPNAGFFKQLLALDMALFPQDQRPLDMASMERHIIPSA